MNTPRIAVTISHPIQHFCPQFNSWSAEDAWNIKVFFASKAGLETYEDEGFQEEIKWPELEMNFPHAFLNQGRVEPINHQLDAPELEHELQDYSPDVLITYGYVQKYQRRAQCWGASNDVPVLMFSDSETRQARSIFKKILKKMTLPFHYRNIDGFLTVGDSNEDYHQQYGARPDQLYRLSYPIDRDFYETCYERKDEYRKTIRKNFDIAPDAFVCGMVGKLIGRKRQKDLIRALKHLDSQKQCVALIVGSGEMKQELAEEAEKVIGHRVILTGFVDHRELPKYYAAMDTYVHASSLEPHSVAISEAIYMGCPVVLSDRCGSYGPADDVRPGYNGFVYSCGDSATLAEKLSALAKNPQLRRDFSDSSRSFARRAQRKSHGEGLKAALTDLGLLME